MYLVGARGQQRSDHLYDASGTITTGGTAQLLLPANVSRSFLMIQNISDTVMTVKFGAARLTATLTSGVITSVAVNDGGFGFTNLNGIRPAIQVLGGGTDQRSYGNSFVGVGQPDYPVPTAGSNNVQTASPASLVPVMATAGGLGGQLITSVTIQSGGSGYKTAPYLHVMNSRFDPIGCATPSATSGIQLAASGGSLTFNGTMCPTDPIGIFCTASSKAFTCIWAP